MNDLTWTVHRGVVPLPLLRTARRLLWQELRYGVSAEEIAAWSTSTWWPHLRSHPALDAIGDVRTLPGFDDSGRWTWCETQILVRLPNSWTSTVGPPHLDEVPPWAPPHATYRRIYGVELGDVASGGTAVHYPRGAITYPRLTRGDVLDMGPAVQHSGSPNLGDEPRMALFYRQLNVPVGTPRTRGPALQQGEGWRAGLRRVVTPMLRSPRLRRW